MKLVDRRSKAEPEAKTPADLEAPARGNRRYYDDAVKGFGVRVTASGTRSFILNYRTRSGRERRYTIGSTAEWSVAAARDTAEEIRRRIRHEGYDPLAELEAERVAPTVGDLCDRFEEEHLPRRRANTKRDYKLIIDREILPALKHHKVAEVSFTDIDRIHRKITKRGRPSQANRTVAVLSKMFSLAIKWKMCSDNPCKGIEKNDETKRRRYLSLNEIARLTKALARHEDQQVANIIRLLMFTGARRGEVSAMRWDQLDLTAGKWVKPGATTKTHTDHEVPLSAPACQLLAELRTQAEQAAKKKDEAVSEYVFLGRHGGHRVEIKSNWKELCKAAGIVTTKTEKDDKGKERVIVKPSARIHDLRHTYASLLASGGASLPLIGELLGHTQAQTTKRYAHLFDEPQRQAAERVGAIIDGKPSAEIVRLEGARG